MGFYGEIWEISPAIFTFRQDIPFYLLREHVLNAGKLIQDNLFMYLFYARLYLNSV